MTENIRIRLFRGAIGFLGVFVAFSYIFQDVTQTSELYMAIFTIAVIAGVLVAVDFISLFKPVYIKLNRILVTLNKYEKLYYSIIVVWIIVFLYTLYNIDFTDTPNFDSNIYWGTINIWSSGMMVVVSVLYILFRGKLDND